jgi:hypothetical protein
MIVLEYFSLIFIKKHNTKMHQRKRPQQQGSNNNNNNSSQQQPTSEATRKAVSGILFKDYSAFSLHTLNNIFVAFAFVNFLSAYLNPISDCDEVYNYWEPTHFLLYGSGFQTWEYSPVFALRSYLYILFHSAVGYIAMFAGLNKIHVFYCIRIALAMFSAFCQMWFMNGIAQRFGKRIATYTFVFMLFASGMFNAVAGNLS